MENSKLHGLPPNKRFKFLNEDKISDPQSHLPAKKRKQPQNPKPLETYCLPAKKRIWALPPHPLPFDLNTDPKIQSFDEPKPPKISENNDDLKPPKISDDEDGILCAVCQSTDGDPSDPIVLCDGCDLMVHVSCYGTPLISSIPDGDWFCDQCRSKSTAEIRCCLCPNLGGAMKAVAAESGDWAHLVCALFVPEVFFRDSVGRDGIDCSKVPKKRWRERCYVCEEVNGCVVHCSEPKCGLGFHVTCGIREDLCIEYKQGKSRGDIVAGFCKKHSDLWRKQEGTGKYRIVARED